MIVNKQDLNQQMQAAGVDRIAKRIELLALSSIRIRTQLADEETLSIGTSKIGGLPDLPASLPWPYWTGDPESDEPERQGGPLCFLAQFNMAETAPYDADSALPKTGMLYFFAAIWKDAIGEFPEDRPCWGVVYWNGDRTLLQRTALPSVPEVLSRDPLGHLFTCCSVALSAEATLPDNNDPLPYESIGMTDAEAGLYETLLEGLGLETLDDKRELTGPTHRLLGYPQTVQYDMRIGAHVFAQGLDNPTSLAFAAEEDKRGAENWRLLLQIDTDSSIGLNWQGGGRGYFWIHEDRLQARDFSDVWLIMQCT